MSLELLCNAEVYAPAHRGRCHLLVGGGKVLWMGSDTLELPETLGVVCHDLAGRRLCPGLIDCHVHLTGGGGEGGFASRVPPLPLSSFTTAGTTTVVGLLGTDDVTRSPAALIAATRGLVAEGLNAFCLTGGYHLPAATLTGSVRGDIVFVDCVIGVGEVAISDHRSSQPTLDELLRVASEAYVGGLLSGKAGIVHLHVGGGARGLEPIREALARAEIPPRIFHPTHVNRCRDLFDQAIDLARRGCTIDISAFPVPDDGDAWSAAAALSHYLDSEAPPECVTISTDAGGSLPRFDAEHRLVSLDVALPATLGATLATLLQQGQELARVLPAFTSNVARVLGLPHKGRLVVGADADLLTLDVAGEVVDVMIGGRWHVRERRLQRRGSFEPASQNE